MRGFHKRISMWDSSPFFTSAAFIHTRRPLPPTGASLPTPLQCSCCFNSTDNGVGNGTGGDTTAQPVVGGRLIQSLQHDQPPRGSGIQPLLDYNKHWSTKVRELDPGYFKTLAEQQNPQYLWIGCSDSRVPANEIVGLFPGDVFVHRNIANIVSNADLNVLSVLHYAIECLKVEHVIVAGHYKCGGVTAALNGTRVGLADHWILHVKTVKRRFWKRMEREISPEHHLDALCELNVITQLSHVVDTHLMQQAWETNSKNSTGNASVELHGWVYGLEDGLLRPLLSLNRNTDLVKAIAAAEEAVFLRYAML